MSFRKIDAPSIKELFATQMKEMILSDELRPGDRLPSERELADLMGISKTIVHEGIRDLVRMGFLTVQSRQGVYVADYTTTGNLETLFAMLEFRGGLPARNIVLDLLDMRIYLECPAMEHLAASHTREHISKLDEILSEIEQAVSGDIHTYASLLFQFHQTITVMTGNSISPLIMNAFFHSSVPAWEHYCMTYGPKTVYAMLKELRNDLERGDGASASARFRACIQDYKKKLCEKS